MTESKTLIKNATVTGVGQRRTLEGHNYRRGFLASLTGTGAISATVVIQVSTDGNDWADRMTFTLSGSNEVTDSDVDPVSPFPFVRTKITAITGTGAAVTVGVAASGDA